MADTKERPKMPRKAEQATPKPDSQAAAPRKASSPASNAPGAGNVRANVPSQETRRQIAEAAYYKAKQRGFAPGHELEDWIEAESEVMGRINGGER